MTRLAGKPNTTTSKNDPSFGSQPAGVTRSSWAKAFLEAANLPTTTQNLKIVVGWTIAENGAPQFAGQQTTAPTGSLNYNPLGSTQSEGGSTDAGGGLQSYTSWQDGITGTVAVLLDGLMGQIVTMLKAGNAPAAGAAAIIDGSQWGTKDLTAAMIDGAQLTGGGAISAQPGGTVGNKGGGGTGTAVNDTANFTVGDSTNPDEDYWTAINRLAQERYWYVFSDGETLYLADGPDLMKQQTAMLLDRILDAGIINHLDLTFDNTAWQYAVTHHQRRKTQRRTALAKVTSPVEAIVDVICKVDEVRAGDVVVLANTGPGDGQWLAGDVTRSVFEVTSELTLVPALSPLSEGQLNPAGNNKNNPSPIDQPIGTHGYTNPVGPGFTAGRIDQGCDGHLAGNYFAPGTSTILLAGEYSGWSGGYISGRLLDGQYKGKCWYVAEGVAATCHPGDVVQSGGVVARPGYTSFSEGPGGIETGWANPASPGNTLASSLPSFGINPGIAKDQSSGAIAAGSSFNRWMTKLGNTNPCFLDGQGKLVKPGQMPPGYP